MENPFKYGGVVRGAYFADRRSEIIELKNEMENLNRIFLVSPRRFGKTCLLFNLIDSLKHSGFVCAYIDLNAYPDIRSFAGALASITSKALETNRDKLLKIFSGFQKLRPKVSVNQNGAINAGVELAIDEKEALSALLEGMGHAEALAAEKKKNWWSSLMNFPTWKNTMALPLKKPCVRRFKSIAIPAISFPDRSSQSCCP